MLFYKTVLTGIAHCEKVISRLKERLNYLNVPEEVCLDVQLALTEAIGNAFLHGCKDIENPQVVIEWYIVNNSIQISIEDNGSGFDVTNRGQRCGGNGFLAETGRGIFLIEQVMDEVYFNQEGTEISCLKRW